MTRFVPHQYAVVNVPNNPDHSVSHPPHLYHRPLPVVRVQRGSCFIGLVTAYYCRVQSQTDQFCFASSSYFFFLRINF